MWLAFSVAFFSHMKDAVGLYAFRTVKFIFIFRYYYSFDSCYLDMTDLVVQSSIFCFVLRSIKFYFSVFTLYFKLFPIISIVSFDVDI